MPPGTISGLKNHRNATATRAALVELTAGSKEERGKGATKLREREGAGQEDGVERQRGRKGKEGRLGPSSQNLRPATVHI